jgi:hypothetical protein
VIIGMHRRPESLRPNIIETGTSACSGHLTHAFEKTQANNPGAAWRSTQMPRYRRMSKGIPAHSFRPAKGLFLKNAYH